MKIKLALGGVLLSSLLYAESVNEALEGFNDTPSKVVQQKSNVDMMDGFDDETSSDKNSTQNIEEDSDFVEGLTGKFTEQVAYSYHGKKPHDKFTMLKSSLFLDYEHKFENGLRFKTNAKAYYDAIYDLRDNEHYSKDEKSAFRSEVELYDAYFEGSFSDNFDIKLGRQVIVWGRSDTIRITDVLNPLDNRRPGMVDIEDLRLPVAMSKFDYFIDKWRITPILIMEQRFSKLPPYGSAFNPLKNPHISHKRYNDVSYALSVGGEFNGWDVNFYTARIHDDKGYLSFSSQKPIFKHEKINMYGTAFNILSGSWLFKTEIAYFDGLKYTAIADKEFGRTDALFGIEYKGIADTLISYDVSVRHIHSYDNKLLNEHIPLKEDTYQNAFRVTSDFMNASLTANYLLSLYGKKLDEGGFQRFWIKYELGEGINMNMGVVDYIGGSKFFDTFKNSDMIFADITYSF